MKTLYKPLSILFLVLFMAGCSKNNEDPAPNPPELQAYLDRFLQEAEQLGKTYDVSKLDLRFAEEPFERGCANGKSNFENSGRQRIVVSKTENCWTGRTDIEKENLFFHEIGHALLGRAHTVERFPNGLFTSIMCTGCSNFARYNNYLPHRREYYIKELIGIENSTPDWGLLKTNFQSFFNDDLSTKNTWHFFSHDESIQGSFNPGDADYPEGGLMFGSKEQYSTNFAYWVKTFNNPQIPQGATLQLQVKFKSIESIKGSGLSIVLRSDKTDTGEIEVVDFNSTQNNILINGHLNQTIELQAPDFQSITDRLRIYIIFLGETMGEAVIEEVNLGYAVD